VSAFRRTVVGASSFSRTAVGPAKAGHYEKKDAGHYEEIASNGNVNRKVAPPFTLLTPHNLPP